MDFISSATEAGRGSEIWVCRIFLGWGSPSKSDFVLPTMLDSSGVLYCSKLSCVIQDYETVLGSLLLRKTSPTTSTGIFV